MAQMKTLNGYEIVDQNAIRELSASGTTVTYTKGDGSSGTITTQDTTYGVATTSANGLMSSSDKTKLDNMGVTQTSSINTLPSGKVGLGYYITYDSSEGGVIAYITISVNGVAAIQYKIGSSTWKRRFRFTEGYWGAWGN